MTTYNASGKKNSIRDFHAFLVAIFWFPLAFTSHAETLTGRVVKVADGDTLTLLDASQVQHKNRISGIDAPERKQPFGAASKKNMSDLAAGKQAEAICYKRDRYKRLTCTVYVNREDVALAQLDAGLAWRYRKYANEQPSSLRGEYESAEDHAAADRVGLWQDNNPIPSWEWRRTRIMTLRVTVQFAAVILEIVLSGSAFTGDFEDGGEIVEELIEQNL